MELEDEITIPAPLDKVYEALNDIAILKACIPGCEELIRNDDGELEAKVTLKIGPVKAKFGGRVTLDTPTRQQNSAWPVKVTAAWLDSPKAALMSHLPLMVTIQS